MDPLCSWCYAFSGNLERLRKEYEGELKFSLLTGGLWYGDNVRKANKGMSRYFLAGNDKIAKRTKAVFGEGFEKLITTNDQLSFDSEPPSRAIAAVSILWPGKVFEFAKQVQYNFFAEGKDMNNNQLYFDIIEKMGLDLEKFNPMLSSSESKLNVDSMFEKVKQLGLASYPALLFNDGDLIFPFVEGYEEYDEVQLTLQELI